MVVAVLIVAAVLLTACNGNVFQPLKEAPASATPEGNGGNAVKYGEWLYYVNGYQSSLSAENTYEQVTSRVGAIARIKIADIESLFEVLDDTVTYTTTTARNKEIARIVAEKAQIVVPKFYYSGNTTSTQINGIYIFNDRLYVLTPNDELTAGGNSQTSQNVLTSFTLTGADEQRHYVFTNNAAQVMYTESENKLLATYIMGSEVGTIDVVQGTQLAKIEETSNATLDVAGKAVFYINSDNAICKLNAGAAEGKVVVDNKKDSTITYTISNVNNGYVYYTKSDSTNSSIDGTHVYCKTETSDEAVALLTSAPSANWYGYNGGIVKAVSDTVNDVTLYGINVLSNDGTVIKKVVDPVKNDNAITFSRIEGDVLYYTSNNVSYMVDLSKSDEPQAFAGSLSTNGWSVPDIVFTDKGYNYVVTLSSSSSTTDSKSVYVAKFDVETKTQGSGTVGITVVEPVEEE